MQAQLEAHQARDACFDLDTALPVIQGLARLHDSIAVLDEHGQIVWASDSLRRCCADGQSLEGLPWSALLDEPGDAVQIEEELHRSGRVSNAPVRLRSFQGETRSASVSAARLGGAASPQASVAIFRIGPPDPVVRQFRLTLEYLSAILDSAPEGVVVIDTSRFITYANPAMSRLTGWSIDELVDKPLALFLSAQDDLEHFAGALRPEGPVHCEDLEVRRRDGSPLCVNVSVALLRLPDGTQMGGVAYVRDVTEQRRFERELANKNAELEHYVNAVSHDLRSPLVAILGFSRLLREDYGYALGEKGQHFLRRIEEAGRTMESLVQHLLQISRIGRTEPDRTAVDPREVLLQLGAEVKPRLEQLGVRFVLPDSPPLLHCDRTHLYQVFSNLVGNALDHMGPCETPEVRVEITEVGGSHRIAVIDNGRGIEPADHHRIFEMFESLDCRRNGRGGNGIGLAVVKKIAEAHGGAAWVESSPGEGARFYVTLPAR
jgi:two-component system sensor kinase FixL